MNALMRIGILSFLLSMSNLNLFSQSDTIMSVRQTDSLQSAGINSKHSLYSGIGFGSSMIYPGTTIPRNQNFGYAALMYGFNNEFFASVSAFDLIYSDHFADFYSFSLSYMHNLNKWLDISLTLARFEFNKSWSDTLINNFIYADITTGIDMKYIYTNFSCSAFLSDKSQFYYQLKNSRYFQTPSFFNGKAFISFNPYVNLLFGTHLRVNTSVVTIPYTSYDTLTISNPNIQPVTDVNGSRIYSGSSSSPAGSTTIVNSNTVYTSTEETSYSKIFGLMEIDLGLPVAINFRKLTIEAEAGYVIPTYSDILIPQPKGFVFMISGFLKFF